MNEAMNENVERLWIKAEQAAARAACEQAACLRGLQGLRPSRRKYTKRLKRINRFGHAGECMHASLQAKIAYTAAAGGVTLPEKKQKRGKRRRRIQVT